MNKSELVESLAARYDGNKKAASHALESVLDTITRAVADGEKVAITGFGSFEKRVREARWVRNPQTGDKIQAKKKSVPKFTPGADLRNVVSGAKKLPKLVVTNPVKGAAGLAGPAGSAGAAVVKKASAVTKSAVSRATPSKSAKQAPAAKATTAAASVAAPAKKAPTKKAATAKATTAKKAPAKKSAASTATKKSPAKKSAAKKS